jgi:hypothetical protein
MKEEEKINMMWIDLSAFRYDPHSKKERKSKWVVPLQTLRWSSG